MKKVLKGKRLIYSVITFAMVVIATTVIFAIKSSVIVEATADDRVRAAEKRVEEAKAEEERIQAEKTAIERDRENLEYHRNNLDLTLTTLNLELVTLAADIAQLELDIENKRLDIELAELDLAEAIRIKEQQYEDMKKRVKYMYERPEFLLIETLLSSSSLTEFLNYADYWEQLAGYDQMKLDEYREIEAMVNIRKDILNQEKEDLDFLLAEVEKEQERVNDLQAKTSSSINYTSAQISEAEQSMLAKEEEIKRKSDEIEQLKKDLEEEKRLRDLANRMAWRSLSDITFAEGDRYLLANLIYCEAGGEPYQGQVAVGAVAINRMLSPVFPDTMVGVIYQSRQFSPVASGRLALALEQNKATDACYRAADEAMSGSTPVGNVLFFRTPIEGVTGQYIGGHVFY